MKVKVKIKMTHLVYPALDDQPPAPRRHQLLEHLLKVLRHLLERALDGLVLALIEHLHELLDRLGRLVQLLAPLQQLIALLCKVRILLKRFLIHVRELLQALVDDVQFLDELDKGRVHLAFGRKEGRKE